MDLEHPGMVSLMTIYERIDPRKKLITGVGSALIDILVHEDDAFLRKTGAIKGGMSYVDKPFIDQTVGMSTLTPEVVPGGSACNTMVGIGRLGGRARFVGKCGNGPMGQLFRTDLQKQNVDPMLLGSDSPTGRVLSIITPDAQRSMFTYLGASAETQPHEITPACFEEAAIVHVEGYLLFNRDLIAAVFESAKKAGALISLDLASFNVVQECRDVLPGLIAAYVDILIANEDEARAYTGSSDEHQALQSLAAEVDLAVLKLGERGSRISHAGQTLGIRAYGNGAPAVDTTGAGDLWAAGFLYALLNRMPLERCGALGALCGYEVCQVVGAHIPDPRWEIIKKNLEE
jgi:sugar/nucleoside kinase (ribokinase family)